MTDAIALSLRCPECGDTLQVERLIIEDEGSYDEVVCFDCPTSDYHLAVTSEQVSEMMTHLLKERLRQELYSSPR